MTRKVQICMDGDVPKPPSWVKESAVMCVAYSSNGMSSFHEVVEVQKTHDGLGYYYRCMLPSSAGSGVAARLGWLSEGCFIEIAKGG